MNLYRGEKSIYHFLKEILDNIEKDKLLAILNEQARIIDIVVRDDFENALLELARETVVKTERKIFIETLVSLESIWNEHIPKKDLSKKFWEAFNKEDYQQAYELFSALKTQGLDYIGCVQLEEQQEGKMLPIETGENRELLHYTDEKLHFLDQDLQLIKTINSPEGQKIIDVLWPLKDTHKDENDVNTRLWILLENSKQSQSIISLDITDKRISNNSITVTEKVCNASRLSWFKNQLLLVSESQTFIQKGVGNWEEWFQEKQSMKKDAENKTIVCTETTKDKFWVGLADNNVRILKDLESLGKRIKFEPLPNSIKSIKSSEKFIVITGEDRVVLSDLEGHRKWEQTVEGTAIKSIILNDETILTLTTNGMLSGRDINKESIRLKINLQEQYDFLFSYGNRVYCTTNKGKVTLFEAPDIQPMQQALISKDIHIMEEFYKKDPKAPVSHLSEFVGRDKIIEQIKEDYHSHYLIAGGPKVGKTSLLKILPEALVINSECCYIDMEMLLKESDSYEDFEKNFIIKCLTQHGLRLEDLTFKRDFQRFMLTMNKIRSSKQFCVFCIDNFHFPFNGAGHKDFMVFLKDMLLQDNSRMILTVSA